MAARAEEGSHRDRESSPTHRDRKIAPTSRNRAKRAIALGALIALSIPIALYAFGFQLLHFGDPNFHTRFASTPVMAAFHVLGGGSALLLGGAQFSTRLRSRAPQLHRWSGRVYLTLVLLGGLGGAALALHAAGGISARFGFMLLALLWLTTGALAYRAIRAGDIGAHRRWMTRNFAMTFGAVTLRLELPILIGGFGLSFDEAYPIVAWLAWVPNLIVADWLLLGRRATPT
jgi:uncharacterized membrane protein